MDLRSRIQNGFALSVIVLLLLVVANGSVVAQQEKPQTKTKSPAVFPDEYSDLDDNQSAKTGNDVVNEQLEESRQFYLRGLTAIERGDTTKAAKLFEQAISVLNELASVPGIDQNEDYTDLAQSIIEDYESYVRSIDDLDENSSMFILRDKLFQEVENYARSNKPVQSFKPVLGPDGKPSQIMTTIPLTQNEFVARSITFYTEKVSKSFKRMMERTGKWFPMLKRIAKEEKMPEEIIHLAMVESALNPNAVSRASAVGMWQFMQATGSIYNLRVNNLIDERRDPEKATRAAMRHLRDLYNEFGDWHLALAAYNCGAGGVKRAIRASGLENPDYWQVWNYLPRETRNYVPLFIAVTLLTMQHDAYGFPDKDLVYEEEYKYDTFVVKEPVVMKALARCAGTTVDELKLLNPELLKNTPPHEGEGYALKIPQGTKEDFAEAFELLTPEEKQPYIFHEVQKGENLATISNAYGVPASEIASNNGLNGYKAKLRRGMTLRIPADLASRKPSVTEDSLSTQNVASTEKSSNPEVAPSLSKSDTKKSEGFAGALVKDDSKTEAPSIERSPKLIGKKLTHTVRQGETLYAIATRYGLRLTDLRNWNNLPYDDDNVESGTTLVIGTRTTKETPVKIDNTNDIVEASTSNEDSGTQTKNTKSAVTTTTPATTEQPAKIASVKPEPKVEKIQRQVPTTVSHTVRRGETLAQIADDFNVSVDAIRKSNKLSAKKGLMAGQTLKINTTKSIVEERTIEPKSGKTLKTKVEDVAEESDSPKPERASREIAAKKVKVKKGQSIGEIAALYDVTERELIKWNPSLKGGKLIAGTYVKIVDDTPVSKGAKSSKKNVNKLPKTYKVQNGDTMYSIARKYGVTVEQLQSKNKSIGGVIRKGQTIRIQ